ncbi:MAG: cytochrome c [Acidobacteria bacterium]|nr:cytochrome c [Acidobacteriota bacterium]
MLVTASTRAFRLAALPAAFFVCALAVAPAAAQQPQRTPAEYTAEQADAGLAAYRQHCASCHGENLDDGPFAPPLRGTAFRAKWYTRSVEALFTETATTMPQDRPDSLGDETYTDLIAFLLQENGIEAGREPLPADPAALAALSTGWRSGGGGLSAGFLLPPGPGRSNPIYCIRPGTTETLRIRTRRTGCCGGAPTTRPATARCGRSLQPTSPACARHGRGRCRPARASRRRSSTTACCSCTASATRCTRSTPPAATCCGNMPAACRATSRRASSAACPSTASACTCRPRTFTWWRSTCAPAPWSGNRR